jgi:hypothetical protein
MKKSNDPVVKAFKKIGVANINKALNELVTFAANSEVEKYCAAFDKYSKIYGKDFNRVMETLWPEIMEMKDGDVVIGVNIEHVEDNHCRLMVKSASQAAEPEKEILGQKISELNAMIADVIKAAQQMEFVKHTIIDTINEDTELFEHILSRPEHVKGLTISPLASIAISSVMFLIENSSLCFKNLKAFEFLDVDGDNVTISVEEHNHA